MIYSAQIKRMKKANKNLKCFKVCPRLYHQKDEKRVFFRCQNIEKLFWRSYCVTKLSDFVILLSVYLDLQGL